MRAPGPVTNPTARALASWLCALWGRHEGARGGRLLPGCGVSGDGRSPTPDLSSVRASGRGPLPTGCGCGGCGREGPSPTPERALYRGGFARCGGGTRAPGGGAPLAWVCGVRGPALSHPRPLVLSGVRPGPTTHWRWVRGVQAWGPVTNPTARPLASWLCTLWGRHEGAWGGRLLPGCGASGDGRSPIPNLSSVRACGRGPLPTGCGCGDAGVGTRHQPHSARSCVLWGWHEAARGGRLLPGCGASGVGRSPTPDHSSFRACSRGPLPTGCGCGGCGRGDPSTTPQRALLLTGFARSGGGTRAPGGGASCLGVGRPGTGAPPPPTTRSFGRAAGARFPLAVVTVCGRGGPAVLGTLSRAAVRRLLCALPRLAAPGGRCGLAPVLVPWLWLAACLSGVPCGPALVRRSSSGPVALGAPVGFPVAVVPSPTPGAVAPGFTGWLRGARGGRPRTGLIVPAAGPCRGKGAGRAPRRTRSGPRDGVGLGLRALRLFGVCGPGH